jgi:hypothetical protein
MVRGVKRTQGPPRHLGGLGPPPCYQRQQRPCRLAVRLDLYRPVYSTVGEHTAQLGHRVNVRAVPGALEVTECLFEIATGSFARHQQTKLVRCIWLVCSGR